MNPSIYAALLAEFNSSFSGATGVILQGVECYWSGNYDTGTLNWGMLTTVSAGNTFVANKNTANFSTYCNLLTSGEDDYLYIGLKTTPGITGTAFGMKESYKFSRAGKKYIDNGRPDLFGCEITNINLYVSSVVFNSPGRDRNNDGVWTDFYTYGTFYIYGSEVPEPATLSLLAVGAMALVRKRKK